MLQLLQGKIMHVKQVRKYLEAVGGEQDAPNANPDIDRHLYCHHQAGRPS